MSAIARYTRRVWKSLLDNAGHEANCFPLMKLGKIGPGCVQASLVIKDHNLNRAKTLHGGVILSLTDTMGSLAVATRGQWMTGVSTDVSASFIKPGGRLGDEVFMESKVVGMGKTLAYTQTEFRNRIGDLVAIGSHTKFIGKTLDHPKNVKFSEDGKTVIEGEDLPESAE